MKKFLTPAEASTVPTQQLANSRGSSNGDGFRRVTAVIFVLIATAAASLAGPNILVNGGFEDTPPPNANLGNHLGAPVAPWVLGALGPNNQQSNVVTVNGSTFFTSPSPSPGIVGDYGTDGPHLDASGSPPGVLRHYLDIDRGQNAFYQSFTPKCDGTVNFGGFFSTRANSYGYGSVMIVQGVGTGQSPDPPLPLIGATNIRVPAGTALTSDSANDPWTPVSSSVSVTGGIPYSFVVKMDNNMNFDEGFVRYEIECTPTPTPTATPTPTPGCAQVTVKDVRCEPNGIYSYTFSVTNGTGKDVPQILLTPAQGSSFRLGPQLFHLASPLHDGQSTTLTVKIGDVKPGIKVCFFVCLMPKNASCCIIKVCPDLPDCAGAKTPTPRPQHK